MGGGGRVVLHWEVPSLSLWWLGGRSSPGPLGLSLPRTAVSEALVLAWIMGFYDFEDLLVDSGQICCVRSVLLDRVTSLF